MRIFNLDSKFMQTLSKGADLMFLNLITLVCCIPIITIGAAITAMHHEVLAIYRDEESYVIRGFFKSFKENFKQSTIIWLIYMFAAFLLSLDFWLFSKGYVEMIAVFKYALVFVTAIVVASFEWVFILQSRYNNTVRRTIMNAFIVSIANIFYTIMMIILTLLPIVLIYFSNSMTPVVCMFGMTIPALLQAILYGRVMDKIEGVDRKALRNVPVDDGWTVELEEDMEDMPKTEEIAEEVTGEKVQGDEEN